MMDISKRDPIVGRFNHGGYIVKWLSEVHISKSNHKSRIVEKEMDLLKKNKYDRRSKL